MSRPRWSTPSAMCERPMRLGSGLRAWAGARGPSGLPTAVLVGATVLAGGVLASAFAVAPVEDAQIWLELVKGSVELVVVVALGGVVTFAFKRWEVGRAGRRLEDDYRLGVLRELVDAYHRTKSVRRTLHASGFVRPPRTHVLTAEQVREFQAQMRLLDDAQLAMEMVAREI